LFGWLKPAIPADSRQRFLRPQVLMKNGKPEYLFCALMGGPHHSSAAVLKIKV